MTNSLLVLGDGILEVLLVVEFIGMLLANLSNDIGWELGVLGNLFCLSEKHFLHESVNFDVVVHLIQLAQHQLVIGVCRQIIHCVVLNLHLEDSGVCCGPVRRNSIIEIVNLQRTLGLLVWVTLTSTSWFKID